MADFKWDDYNQEDGDFNWDEYEKPEAISPLESTGRGFLQGGSLGFADEITGGVEALADTIGGSDESWDDLYSKHRDESRANFKKAEKANPVAYGAGQLVGGGATAFIPVLNVAKGASLGVTLGKLAGLGATQAVGDSEATNARDLAEDALMGGAIGAGTGLVGEKVIAPLIKNAPGYIKRGLVKGAKYLAGVDEDAALRQLERPFQSAAAEADGFGYEVGKKAMDEISEKGSDLGQFVGQNRDRIVDNRGLSVIPGVEDTIKNTEEFLQRNKPSQKKYSALSSNEREELNDLVKGLRDANAEDVVKLREQIDRDVSHLYGNEGKATPFERQLMAIRGQLDKSLDEFDPLLNKANQEYSEFARDKGLLGLNKESTAETVTNNLYSGANKTAKQGAAENLLSDNTLDKFRDIAGNKAFDNAKKPGGDNYFRRGALAALTAGASEVVTNPSVYKHTLRTIGKAEDRISYMLKNNPQVLGKFAKPLQEAMGRGPQAVAATHYILSEQNPEYRKMINGDDNDSEK